jgi:hypothetical protein
MRKEGKKTVFFFCSGGKVRNRGDVPSREDAPETREAAKQTREKEKEKEKDLGSKDAIAPRFSVSELQFSPSFVCLQNSIHSRNCSY